MIAVRIRIFARETVGEHGHLRLRVFERPAVLQASDDGERPAVAAGRVVWGGTGRGPQLRGGRGGRARAGRPARPVPRPPGPGGRARRPTGPRRAGPSPRPPPVA